MIINPYLRFFVIFYFLLISIPDFASEPKKVFLGINGSDSDYSNMSHFEDELDAYAKAMSARGYQTKILNAGGTEGKKIVFFDSSYPQRDSMGNLILSENKIRTEPASVENINKIYQQAHSEKPDSVVILFTDHGDEKGVTTWKGDVFSYDNMRALDQSFSENTIVRRINSHCYSGRALAPTAPIKNVSDILAQFPANRCGFSSADVNELATDTEGLHTFLNRGRPSLATLKSYYLNDETYVATPRLTSDYMKDSILKVLCHPTTIQSCGFSPSSINSVTMACKTYEFGQAELQKASRAVGVATEEHRDHDAERLVVIKEFLQEKYPKQAQLVKEYLTKIEANEVYRSLGRTPLSISDAEKEAYTFWRTRLRGIDYKVGATGGWDYIKSLPTKSLTSNFDLESLNKIFLKYKNPGEISAFVLEQWSNRFGNKVLDPDAKEFFSWAISKEMNESPQRRSSQNKYRRALVIDLLQDDMAEVQKERQSLRKEMDIQRDELVERLLSHLPSNDLKSRLENIKKCETTPLAQ